MDLLLAFGLPSGPEWFFIGAIVILLFGAKKLPELARGLGQSVGEFRKAKEEFERELHKSTQEVQAKEAPEKEQAALPPQPSQPSQPS